MILLAAQYGLALVLFSNSPEYTKYETYSGVLFIIGCLCSLGPRKQVSYYLVIPVLLFGGLLFIQSLQFSSGPLFENISHTRSWLSIHALFIVALLHKKSDHLYFGIGFGMLLGMILNSLEYFDVISYFDITKGTLRFGGTLINPNGYAVASVALLFWSVIFRKWLKYWPLIVILSLHIIWYQALSRTFMAVSLVGFVVLFVGIERKIILIRMTAVFAGISLINFEAMAAIKRIMSSGFESMDISTDIRVEYIKEGLGYWLKKPFFGWGTDGFREINNSSYSHNNYVEILCNHGLLGFIVYYTLYAWRIAESFLQKNYHSLLIVVALAVTDLGLVSFSEKACWYLFYLGLINIEEE